MKKIIAITLLLALALTMLASCSNKPVEPTLTRVAGMTGPTSIGMVKMISDAKNQNADGKYEFTIAGSADEITPKLIKGELDIAAVPANVAAKLYNKTEGALKLIAINNLSVLYIVDKNFDIETVGDLSGKTIYATGKGSTPEYTLRHVLEANGISPDSDVTIEFKSEPGEVVALLNSTDNGVAMLPMPYVIAAEKQVDGLEIALDLGAEWKRINPESETVTGVIIARGEFIENNPEAVNTFLHEYTASCEYVNANVEEAAVMVEEAGLFKAAIAKEAIPYCNVTGTTGSDMIPIVDGYFSVLFELDPTSVGGKLPGDDFYYTK